MMHKIKPTIEDREAAILLYMKFRDAIYETDVMPGKAYKNTIQHTTAFREALCYRATQYYYKVLGDKSVTDGAKELFIDNIKQVYPNIIVW